ncbi:MAG: hypothetical protein JWP94_484 [Mucilaginibacter sp.]|nr:hypothetical protein [Mucilaginibacter sp.]
MPVRVIIFRHIFVWLIFIGYETAFIFFTLHYLGPVFHYILFYSLNICLFYATAHIILDYAFFKTAKPYLIAFTLIAVEMAIYLLIKFVIDFFLAKSSAGTGRHVVFDRLYVITNIWRGLYFIGLSIAYWSMLYMIRFKERNHVMERAQLKAVAENLELENKYIIAENAYLQNQISRHLLFNSLNFIYNAVHRLSDRAGKGVMLLAEIMRYSLVSSEDNRTVPLTTEVEQIEKLIELSRLRFEEAFFIRFRKKGRLNNIRILPLVLITLVENMVKHGDLGEADCPALILLERTESTLIFETRNKKRSSSPHRKCGIGLKNINKRLVNFYQDRFSITVVDSNGEFSVTLILHL